MVGLECVADGKYKHFKYTQIQIHIVIFKMVSNKNNNKKYTHGSHSRMGKREYRNTT